MKRKSLISIFIALMMLCLSMLAIVGCSKKPAKLETVTITNKTALAAEWHIGDADRTVAVAFAPDSFTADNTSVVLTSDNRDAVVADGMVLKAVGLGKAKITATADGKTDTVDVEVSPKLTGIAITNKNVLTSVWFIGDDARMVEVKLSPDDFTLDNTDVQITSSNPQAIKAEGKTLTALAEGTSTITAKAGEFSDTVDVTVSVPELAGISINEADLKKPWTVGDADREVVVTYDPAIIYNNENTPYTITSDNTSAVTVIENKKIHAVALGEAKITVAAGNKTAEVTINVRPALESVSISNEEALKAKWVIGDAARTVEVSFAPSDYSSENTTVEITSSNEQAIVVSGKTLTAIGLGKSTITVTAGDKTAEVELEVVKPDLTKIAIGNKEELNAKWAVGDATRTLNINYTPHDYYNGDNTTLTVSSSNTNAITVSGKTLTAAGVGTSKITVTYGTGENALTDSVEITVVRPDITSVTITNKDDLTADWQMNSGTKSLTISLAPAEYYSLADVEVISSDSNIVSVNKTNDAVTLTAVSGGEATITVKVGSRQDSVTINVVRPALTSLSITSGKTLNWTLDGNNSATISVSFNPAEYYSAVDVTVTASGDNIVTTDGLTLTANGNVGTATITVAYKDDATIKDTITVKTTVSDPSIELSGKDVTLIESGDKQGQYQLNGLHGATIALPTVTKTACDERNEKLVLDDLVLSDTVKMTLENNKLTVSEKGEFTVTYTVKDSRDETKTATATLNISIFRKVLADNGDYSMKEGCAFVEDDKQVVVGSNTDISFVPFNVQPSKNYYAEVTFDSKYFLSTDGGWWESGIGMGHFLPNVSGRLLMSYVDKAKTHKVKDFNTAVSWETNEKNDASIIYSYKEARIGVYDKSTMFALPDSAAEGKFTYFVPNRYIEKGTEENKDRFILSIPEDFVLKAQNKDEEVIEYTVQELHDICDGTSAEDYMGEESENEDGEEKSSWFYVTLDNAAKVAKFDTSTLFKMPKGDYEGYTYYISNAFIKENEEKGTIRIGIPETYNVKAKNNKTGDEINLTAEDYVDEVKNLPSDMYRYFQKPSEEAQKQFGKVEEKLRKNLPKEMLDRPNWVAITTFEKENGKLGKRPVDCNTGKYASDTDSATWADFDTACSFAKANGMVTLAYALDGKDKIACIDIDGCMDENGDFSELAQKTFNLADGSYAEKSVSGKGLHIFGKTDGSDLRSFSKDGDMEYYRGARFIAVTGDNYGSSELKSFDTPEMKGLLESKFDKRPKITNANKGVEGFSTMDDREVYDRACNAYNGDTFKRLFNGEDLQNNHSNSDMALMNRLAFWCNGDREQMLRMFAASGLYRPEKSQNYYECTLLKALEGTTDRYNPKPKTEQKKPVNGNGNNNGGKR